MSIALLRGATFVALLLAFSVTSGGRSPVAAAEFRANTFTNGDQGAPSASPLGGGAFVVAWVSAAQDGNGFGVYAQRYQASGAKAGAEFRVNTTTIADQAEPSVAMLSGGGFVIVWTSSHHPTFLADVYGQRYNASGGKVGGEFLVNTYRTNKQGVPAVAALANNAFVVVWASENQDGSDHGIYAQRYRTDGTRAGTEFRVNTVTANRQTAPAVSLYGTNAFVVAWASRGQDGANSTGVYAQRYNGAGAKVGGEFRVNVATAGTQHQPAIARLKNGSFVIVFGSENGTSEVILRRFTATGGAATVGEFRVNTFTNGDQSFPSVAGTAGGGFTVAWMSTNQDGSGRGVYAQRYNAGGTRVGFEFRANETTQNNQQFPTIAPWSTSGFVIIWSSIGQDPSGYAVIGKRFAN
jgi:hypothetical protein